MNQLKLALIGAGERGQNSYAPYAALHGYEMKFVAVAEPIARRRERFRQTYGVPQQCCYHTAEEFFAQPKTADAVMICTQDNQHFEYAKEAIRQGYHILLEKPISPSAWECLTLQRLAEEKGTMIMVCHVLRFTPFYRQLKKLLDSGVIGEVASVTHTENVGYWHYAHSYVRGNWHNSETASPMILAKCCHDMDILSWLLGQRCVNISSHGGLYYFNQAHAPKGAPKRCLDGCPESADCPFYAPAVYMSQESDNRWPTAVNVLGRELDMEGRIRALREGPYGICVFHNDNNVVDHQTATMEFEKGTTVAFTMCGLTQACSRVMKFMGTRGEICADMDKGEITVAEFGPGIMSGPEYTYKIVSDASNHSGGDDGIMKAFLQVLRGEQENTNTISQSVHSHIMSLAAEASRLNGKTVNLKTFEKDILDAYA